MLLLLILFLETYILNWKLWMNEETGDDIFMEYSDSIWIVTTSAFVAPTDFNQGWNIPLPVASFVARIHPICNLFSI